MAQIDTKYLKTDPNKNNEKSIFANKKGGIFIIICAVLGMSMDVVRFIQILNGTYDSDVLGVILWMCFGLGLIVLGIVMIANDRKPRKEG